MTSAYKFSAKTIEGETISLERYAGNWALLVNVASKCGLTPQYAGLQNLYEEFKDKNFVVLGFPCNQFGAQEPGSEEEIKEFCSTRFQLTFPMFSKIDVNGPNTHPLYNYLKSQKAGSGQGEDIEWNFAKFLVNPDGQVVERFHPKTSPEEIKEKLQTLLA